MVTNYYTLRLIAADLRKRLVGRTLTTAFSQNRNELILSCAKTGAEDFVVVVCEPSFNALYLRPAFPRAKKNTIEFFDPIHDKRITDIALQPGDRDVRFSFENEFQLAIQMFGAKSNVFLADRTGRILETFLRPGDSKGETLHGAKRAETEFPHEPSLFVQSLRSASRNTAFAALKERFPLLGSTLARETLTRAGVSDQAPVADLTDTEIGRLFACTGKILEELERSPSPKVYFRGPTPVVFSLLELRSFNDLEGRTFPSIHDAVKAFLSSSYRQRNVLREKAEVLRNIDREQLRIERTLAKISSELAAPRTPSYETMGKLLMSNLSRIQKGMKSIVLENVFTPAKESIEIALDPALSPSRNAERYFEKEKKTRHAAAETLDRKRGFDERRAVLRRLRENIEAVQEADQWKEFAHSSRAEFRRLGVGPKESNRGSETAVPFRVFRVEGDFEVWVGKRSDNNDLLTFKYARPDDLWFHARGSSGSHVVLRRGTGKGEISKKAMEQAAAIAAYYSKMKTSGLVPVAITERKYVRKPRGAPSGTVTIQREKVLMVKPKLPGDLDHRGD